MFPMCFNLLMYALFLFFLYDMHSPLFDFALVLFFVCFFVQLVFYRAHREDIAFAQSEIENLKSQLPDRDELNSARSEIEKLKSQLSAEPSLSPGSVRSLQNRVQSLERRIPELQSALRAKDEEIHGLQSLLSDSESQMQDLQTELKFLKAKNRDLAFKLSEVSPLNSSRSRKSSGRSTSRSRTQPAPLPSKPRPAPKQPAASDHFSLDALQALVNSWSIYNAETERRACDPNAVSDPSPVPNSSGLYRFTSKNAVGVVYETSLRSCNCPSYTRTDEFQRRPCKHMIRLAIHLNFYEKARFPQNQAALDALLADQIGDLPF